MVAPKDDIPIVEPDSPRPSVSQEAHENPSSHGCRSVPAEALRKMMSLDQLEPEPLDTSSQPLDQFYHRCLNRTRIQLFTTSAIVLVLAHFHINFFVTLIVLWCASFKMGHSFDSYKKESEFFFWKEKSKSALLRNDPPGEETVSWLNKAFESLWPLISPDIFRPIIDLLEDTLKTLAPGIVTTVRVEDVDQGRNPLVLVAFKALDDKDPWVKNQVKTSDLSGEFFNLEVEFAYQKSLDCAITNAHFVAYFGIGVQKIASCEMPVFVQIDGLHGKIKLRIQLIAVPPFLQTTTFSLSYTPQVEITAKPMHGFNVASLPLISSFIRSSINTLLGNFCVPSSYTLDLSRILLGEDALTRPRHVGVVAIAIHSASNLKASDILAHTSNSYVSISFTKSASKPLFSTRIHFKDLSPVFEETAFILITPDQLLERERICLTICDSDRISSDNVLGKVDVDLNAMTQDLGIMQHHFSELSASFPGFTAQGSLTWSSGYFGFHKDFTIKEPPNFASANQKESLSKSDTQSKADEPQLTSSPARPNSGIISVQIHSLSKIEIRNAKHFRTHNQLKLPHSRKLESDERNLPSTYCFVLINDERVFETRVKKHNSDPYINTGTERFLQDFDRSRIDLVVMEVRAREHDSIVGIVSIPLTRVLGDQQQLTKWWTLSGGNGSGKMRASILFQPIDVRLERSLCSWSVGVIEIFKVYITGLPVEYENCYMKIKVDSQDGQQSKLTEEASPVPSGQSTELSWVCKPRLKLAVINRMQGLLSFQLMKRGVGKLSIKDRVISKPTHVWLSDILQDEMFHIDVELLKTDGASNGKLDSLNKLFRRQQLRPKVESPQLFGQLPENRFSPQGSMSQNPQPSIITGWRSGCGEVSRSASIKVPSIPHQLQEIDKDIHQELENSSIHELENLRFHASFRFVPGIAKVHRELESVHPGLKEIYQTCQRTIIGGDRMRHPVFVDTYNSVTNPESLSPVPENRSSLEPTDYDHRSIDSVSLGTPSLPERSEDGQSTVELTDKPPSGHRLEILDLDEAAEHWTDDEAASVGVSIRETNDITVDNSKLTRLKDKAQEILKEAIVLKIAPHSTATNNEMIPSASNNRRRRELKGISKEVYNLGSSKLKAVRTVKWAKDSAKVGLQKLKHAASHQTPQHKMEKEEMSSF